MFFVKKFLTPLRFAAMLLAFVAGALYAGGSDDETEGVVACAAQSGWPFLAVQPITQLPIPNLTATFCLQSDDEETPHICYVDNLRDMPQHTPLTALRVEVIDPDDTVVWPLAPHELKMLSVGDEYHASEFPEEMLQNFGRFSNLTALSFSDMYEESCAKLLDGLAASLTTLTQFRFGNSGYLDDRHPADCEKLGKLFRCNPNLELVVLRPSSFGGYVLNGEFISLSIRDITFHGLADALSCLENVRVLGVFDANFDASDLQKLPKANLEHLCIQGGTSVETLVPFMETPHLKALHIKAYKMPPQAIYEGAEVIARLEELSLVVIANPVADEFGEALLSLEQGPQRLFLALAQSKGLSASVAERLHNRFGDCGPITDALFRDARYHKISGSRWGRSILYATDRTAEEQRARVFEALAP